MFLEHNASWDARTRVQRWQTNGEYGILVSVAYRPDLSEFDHPLTRDQLAELCRGLAKLGPQNLVDAYRNAHERCRMDGDLLPRAAALQELVTVWKLMRAYRRRRGG